ncbi:hypothetical protein CBR_g30634 [Chara braunii]|uniref:JmjC domain-containing protein n=1 Tax=Chara braunii TaxID=69332 RepID=A0A388LD89_CHABU|nr:hypothetical protein CBR_g30634 [Chara braunii]|eukprot:GBG80268.1 hypothetical protein CBR_g30634 [Chara braunii]
MASAVAMVVGAGGAGKEGERERIVGRVSRKRSSRHNANGYDHSEPCADVDGIGSTRQPAVRRRFDHNPNEPPATAGSSSSAACGSTIDQSEPETSVKGSAAASSAVATTETRTESCAEIGGDRCPPVEPSARRSERLPARARQAPQRLEPLSREEEAMLRRALQNSLAVTKRESDTDAIRDAPVFHPSLSEFEDPVRYISMIRPEAEKYGICKIIPPNGWRPPFCLDMSTRFVTRRQRVHKLQEGEGFAMGKEYSVTEFKHMAKKIEAEWIRKTANGLEGDARAAALEREFWRIVETETESMEVEYGSDLMVGSGFPRKHPNRKGCKFSSSPWNLLNLPRLEGSLLRYLDGNVAGVTVPWLYIGMLFTAFCFHTEDNYLYSVNYHHIGATKTWYGIPSSHAAAFERAMKQEVPMLFADHPDLLHQLVTIVPPSHLLARKVGVYRCRQNAGEFVITFPQAYHAGFNHGFNCAEAVNFAPPDWLPYGAKAPTAQMEKRCCDEAFSIDEHSDKSWQLPLMKP